MMRSTRVKNREVNFLIFQNMIFLRHFEGIERCWWNLFYDSVPGVLDVREQSNGGKSAVVFLGEKKHLIFRRDVWTDQMIPAALAANGGVVQF